MNKELPKVYEPQQVESRVYQMWEDHDCFKGVEDPGKKPFSIVMPPPHVTGQLHMGHALDCTLQDILTRFKRMQGYAALWLPGTDHAGIATQIKVEEELRVKEGKTRYDLGREKFLERVWKWKEEYGNRIVQQQIAGPQQPGQRPGEQGPRQADRQADAHRHQGQKAEVPPGLLQISSPHLVGHHGGAAGAQHDPHGQGKADGRIGHIGGGQGVLSHQAGNQHPVHDGVEADHQHHNNGGQGKAQQPRQVEVAVQAVGHG